MKTTNMITMTVLWACMLTACEQPIQGDAERNWQADATYYNSSDEQVTTTYYKPYAGFVGDPMPFFDPQSQTFRVLYLLDYRSNPVGIYHPI
ncbi:MAG: hypothetical protein IJT12_09115 [Paludibacteraceae bacterium]|nr:hypothetical protein [Paludibacteraceae bacterium]